MCASNGGISQQGKHPLKIQEFMPLEAWKTDQDQRERKQSERNVSRHQAAFTQAVTGNFLMVFLHHECSQIFKYTPAYRWYFYQAWILVDGFASLDKFLKYLEPLDGKCFISFRWTFTQEHANEIALCRNCFSGGNLTQELDSVVASRERKGTQLDHKS